MPIPRTTVDPRSPSYLDNRVVMLDRLTELDRLLDQARTAGGPAGFARERAELLLDRDTPFLELCPLVGRRTPLTGRRAPEPANLVGGIGTVAGRLCLIISVGGASSVGGTLPSHDAPTASGITGHALRKARRLADIAIENQLPMVHLLGDPPGVEIFLPGSGYLAGPADYTIGIAGGTLMSRGAGIADVFGGDDRSEIDGVAEDGRDAIRLTRARLRLTDAGNRTGHPEPGSDRLAPRYDPEDLLALDGTDPREVLARILDRSEFDEYRPHERVGVVAGWGELHGYPVGVLADVPDAAHRPDTADATDPDTDTDTDADVPYAARQPDAAGRPDDPRTARKAARFARLNGARVPLIVLRDTRLGSAALAPANVGVSLVVHVGGGPVADRSAARFTFGWPTGHPVTRPSTSTSTSTGWNETSQGETSQDGAGWDTDAVIDPRDTRTALSLALHAVHSGRNDPAGRYG